MTAAFNSPAADLSRRLNDLHQRHGDTVAVDEIAEIVDAILTTMTGDLSAHDLLLYSKLRRMSDTIARLSDDVAALRPDHITHVDLPVAMDELGAIADDTAEAAHTILDNVERIDALTDGLDDSGRAAVIEANTRIIEACEFQDITGQRITKIAAALEHVERQVDMLIRAFGQGGDRFDGARPDGAAREAADHAPSDPHLLHGPQLKKNANTQEDIDALLAGLD